MMPSKKYLEECFYYNKDTGDLIWKVRPVHHFDREKDSRMFKNLFSGKIAGSKNLLGGLTVRINGKQQWCHRVIYKMMTGKDPDKFIDHIDRNRFNNKWDNLRQADRSKNGANRTINKNNTHGLKGVSFWQGKYKAQIGVNGKKIHLGSFETKEAAHEAYCIAAKAHFKDYSRAV